jgi:putative Mg2+ transporter-C (MgtC) family protein
VTSAAVIWVLAGLGLMIGLGYLTQSVVITVLALTVLLGVDRAENRVKALRRGVHQRMQQRKTSTRIMK